MSNPRIFIIGHPGAGKALVAKTLADKIGWKFINADLELEHRVGRPLTEILGKQGETSFNAMSAKILESLQQQENIVVTTDASIISNEKNRKILFSALVIYVKVSLPIQLKRISRNPNSLLPTNMQSLLETLHQERDELYEKSANLIIDSDDSALEEHVLSIINFLSVNKIQVSEKLTLNENDIILFHKKLHVPIHLSEQQAKCIKLLSQGKSAKEIAQQMNISHRTVEGYIAKAIEMLGCTSSKELITLYHDQPGSK